MGELAGSGVVTVAAEAAEPADVVEAEWVVAAAEMRVEAAGAAAAPAGAATVPTAAVTTAATAANLARGDMLMRLQMCGGDSAVDTGSTEGMQRAFQQVGAMRRGCDWHHLALATECQ
ncbi:hypothetical protein [Catenulispora rubra]|uniref:hypothetical protein n=1 Tax=Catenulispora rubra TaxID=280293 RepID=UPI0018928600|nr:hypothetical protein [Catenulispora rubra]